MSKNPVNHGLFEVRYIPVNIINVWGFRQTFHQKMKYEENNRKIRTKPLVVSNITSNKEMRP